MKLVNQADNPIWFVHNLVYIFKEVFNPVGYNENETRKQPQANKNKNIHIKSDKND